MERMSVDAELLRELLNAASRTALSHRGSEHECYVLGQLEATANMAYVLCASSENEELELLCQQLALDALNRHSEISSTSKSANRKSAGKSVTSTI